MREGPREGEEEKPEKHGRLVRVVKPDWEGMEKNGSGSQSGTVKVDRKGKGRERRKERICWIGHAGVLMQIPRVGVDSHDGDERNDEEDRYESGVEGDSENDYVGVIFDPIFSKRSVKQIPLNLHVWILQSRSQAYH